MIMVMIVILVMANVGLRIIISVLVLLSDKTSFIYYHFSKNVNDVSTENENASSSMNATNKRKRVHDISSKLWHCCLGHILRGRIERLIKKSILPPLKFSDLAQCIDCIKGKYVKKIKKNIKQRVGILEIIHTDICGPFSVKSVNGYDSFITYGYIYPIKERSKALDKFKIFKAEIEISTI